MNVRTHTMGVFEVATARQSIRLRQKHSPRGFRYARFDHVCIYSRISRHLPRLSLQKTHKNQPPLSSCRFFSHKSGNSPCGKDKGKQRHSTTTDDEERSISWIGTVTLIEKASHYQVMTSSVPSSSSGRDDDNHKKEFHVAPMMGITYREFRYFIRLLTRHATLWTEMIVDATILHTNDLQYHLGFDPVVEPPVICQFGGNQAQLAAKVTQIVRAQGYKEINLNAGCPSHRVACKRAFGAALLQDVPKTINMLRAMQEAIQNDNDDAKISIKIRIGVDNDNDWTWTHNLIAQLSTACQRFYVHARKVHTAGLDPAQNRRIPPLDYPRVYALCRAFPQCEFWINGGILTLAQAKDICFGVEQDGEGENANALADQQQDEAQQEHYSGLIPPGHGRLI